MDLTLLINSLWVALAAILVLLMNFGLGFFYSGLVSERNALNAIKMSLITLGVVPIIWWLGGYSLAFFGNNPFIGSPVVEFLLPVGITDVMQGTKVFSLSFICFQAMFASIAPGIISGAGVERLKFRAYLLFIILWVLLVYCTIAHSVWSQHGWAATFGAFDFAGGLVVHVSAGFSGLALAMVLKPRKSSQSGSHNLPLMVVGCGLLWFGWFGFNAGSALEVSPLAIQALANTLFATSAAMAMWVLLDIFCDCAHTTTGICNALIIGLVAITPSAGYVGISAAIAIGAIVSGLSYFIIIYYKRIKHAVDDTLDVFTCHGIPGFLGGILVGVFATNKINAAIPNGLIYGNWALLWKQFAVTCLVAAFSFIATYVILKILNQLISLRVSEEKEFSGLDAAEHGERAYKK